MTTVVPRTGAQRISEVDRRVRQIENPTGQGLPEGGWSTQVAFSQGDASTAVEVADSGRWYPRHNCTLDEVVVWLATAGTTNTVVTVKVNGSSVGAITLGSGELLDSTMFSTDLRADVDYVTVHPTTAGTGALGLTGEIRTI